MSNIDRCRRYRRNRREREMFRDMFRDMLPDIIQVLREELPTRLRHGRFGSLDSPLKNLPSEDIESHKEVPPFEVPPRGARKRKLSEPLAEWKPSEAHRRQASEQEGWDDTELARQAECYRDQQANAKHKHTDREAGFRNWIRNSRNFERGTNGHGKANGHAGAFSGPPPPTTPAPTLRELGLEE